MRIPRIYSPNNMKPGETIELSLAKSNHILHVLRLKLMAPLALFNGTGNEYRAHITEVNQRKVMAKIDSLSPNNSESPLKVHLVQGISKGDKMDFIIQKTTELGINRIIPVFTDRCEVKLNEEKSLKKQHRWKTIAIGACEQCGRTMIPVIEKPQPLKSWLTNEHPATKLLLSPNAENSLTSIKPAKTLAIMVGPEGGLSEEEITFAKNCGATTLKLGPRILRTETAAITTLSALQTKWGDFL